MATWHSLSGYLEYKTGGALGKLVGSRRLWFILEDSSSLLLFYKTKDDATKHKEPKGKIPLQGAGIALNPREKNQFIVLSGEKEHSFTADNHESMMVWLMGLQAKRDFFAKKRMGVSTIHCEGAVETIHEEYEVIGTPPVEDFTQTQSMQQRQEKSLPATLNTVRPLSNSEYPDNTETNTGSPRATLKQSRSLTTSTLDLFRRKNNQVQWREERLKRILGESMDGGLDLYKDQDTYFTDLSLKSLDVSNEFVHLPDLPHVKRQAMFSSAGSLLSEGDNVFAPDTVVSADEVMLSRGHSSRQESMELKKACSEGMDINQAQLYRDSQKRSGSGRSGSSDSLLDRNSEHELLTQLNELEHQLITTKCEMAMLLNRETCYKDVLERRDSIILDMDEKIEELAKRKEDDRKSSDKRGREEVRQLQNQNRFLNEEVKRLTHLRQRENDNIQQYNKRIQELHAEIEKWKRDYVYLLQSTISIPTGDVIDGMEVTLYGGSRHKERVRELLEDCRKTNPVLPIFERLEQSEGHIDIYGFKRSYPTEGLMLHYICHHLHQHYQSRLTGWEENHRQWAQLLRRNPTYLVRTKELKLLCRAGVPDSFRAEVWRKMVYGQVWDIMEEKGPHYYNHLVNMAYDSQYAGQYRKQIMLDLLRTMPSNINFNTKESEGILRMREVLQAFCMHNPDIGYCQGLNFIVGMCLLFLDTEDAFWTLVAITEKYFSSNYFDKSLTGAQADQEVLKDMLRYKLPRVYEHLESIDIELSTVTFNWFLAIFFEAVPFQTLMRIWDCFLMEGPKVLFRFSLAIIKINQVGILAKKDTINVMRHLKVCGKLMFDTDGLMRVAFNEMKPFPRRRDIAAKQVVYLNALKEKLKKREAYRRSLEEKNKKYDELDMIPPSALVYECAAPSGPDMAWVCVGEQTYGKVMSVMSQEGLARDTEIEVESHILCVCCLEDEIFMIGTLSKILHAYSVKTSKELWCLTLNDSIFSLCSVTSDCRNRLYAGMGDGTVAVIDQIQPKEPQDEPFYVPVGRSPVGSMVCVNGHMWVACGNSIHLMQTESMDMLDKISISSNPFDQVLTLAKGPHGIWTTIKGSSVLELWDDEQLTCKMLFDVRFNKIIPRKGDDDGSLNKFRIMTLLPIEEMLWVGTGDGILTMYTVHDRSHLKRNSSNHSLRDSLTSSTRDLYKRSRSKEVVGRTRGSKVEKRINREATRSREMLLNGMLEDEDEEAGRDRLHFKGPLVKRDKSIEGRIPRTRRSRVQDVKMVPLSTSYPGPDSDLSTRNKQLSKSSVDVRQFTKPSGSRNKAPDALKNKKRISKSSVDVTQLKNIQSRPINIGEVASSPAQTPPIKPEGFHTSHTKSYKTIKAKLQRQSGISNKKTSSEDDLSKSLENEKIFKLEGKSAVLKRKTDNIADTNNSEKGKDNPGKVTDLEKALEKFRSSLTSLPKELMDDDQPKGDLLNDDDDVFNDVETGKVIQNGTHSVTEKLALRSMSLGQSSSKTEDLDNFDKEDSREVNGPESLADNIDDELTNPMCDMVVPCEEDFNQNVPSKYLPDILRGNLTKRPAPPQESTVTARSHTPDPTITVCAPSSISTLSDGGSSSEPKPKPGLARDTQFQFDDDNLKYKSDDIRAKSGDIRAKGGDIRNKSGDIRAKSGDIRAKSSDIRAKSGDIRAKNSATSAKNAKKMPSTSTDSTTGAATSSSTLCSVDKSDIKSAEELPEIEVNVYNNGKTTIKRTMSKSMELIEVSDTSKESGLQSDPQLLRTGIEINIGGSTPDLSMQSLSPSVARNKKDSRRKGDFGKSEESLLSTSTLSSSSFSDLSYLIDLGIQTKVKVSDRPVKCLVPTSCNGSLVVLSCAGCYGDDEAVLKWTKKTGESIWTNEPVLEVCPITNMPRRPSYMQHMIASQRSLSM